jgi:hypothetical protein
VSDQFLVVKRRPGRLERLDIRPAFQSLAKRELALRGIPVARVTAIGEAVVTDWDQSRVLSEWLAREPSASLIVLCDRFRGRKVRHILRAVLRDEEFRRVTTLAVPDLSYNESNWWRCRRGVLDLFSAYLQLGYVLCFGERTREWRRWDPDLYEKTLRRDQ